MLKKTLYTGTALLALTLMAGCASKPEAQPQEAAQAESFTQLEVLVIRVNGYGTVADAQAQISPAQRRLLAMRASKMDAYRALAERVNGTRIQGITTVSNLATTDDNIRSYVDSLVRDARVSNVRELSDGSFETQLELVLEPQVQRCLLQGNVENPVCRPAVVSSQSTQPSPPRARYHLD